MQINSKNKNLEYEFFLIAKQFFPYEQYNVSQGENFYIEHTEQEKNQKIIEIFNIFYKKKHFLFKKEYILGSFGLEYEKEKNRFSKLCFYDAMVKLTKRKLDWGCLTGVHPTKIGYEVMQNVGIKNAKSALIKRYRLSNKKSELLIRILNEQIQNGFKNNASDEVKSCIFYINIPFCTSKCSYCSFISAVTSKCKDLIPLYVDALIYDIQNTLEFIKNKNIKIESVYIGGGTPTSLDAEYLDRILSTCNFSNIEFTVEAGRPDTITKEKLEILKKHNVTRISINPQTFNQEVLDKIGRNHSVQDVYEKYALAKEMGFKINMDLIAGLPDDTYKSFKHSVNCALKLKPQNITIHTLALKTKANLIKENFSRTNKYTKNMIDYSYKKLTKFGYNPYYIYRQKNMLENQENVGWSLPNNLCEYNINSMEDFQNVIGCGANSISKRIFKTNNRIERCDCPKDIKTYIEKIQKIIKDKEEFFS